MLLPFGLAVTNNTPQNTPSGNYEFDKVFNYKLNCYIVSCDVKDFTNINALLAAFYNYAMADYEINDFAPQGKIVLATGFQKQGVIYNIHPNVLIPANSTLSNYLSQVKQWVIKRCDDGYSNDLLVSVEFMIRSPKIDDDLKRIINRNPKTLTKSERKKVITLSRGIHTSAVNCTGLINKLKTPKTLNPSNVIAMDIETVESKFNKNQIPVAITLAHLSDGVLTKTLILADTKLLRHSINEEMGVGKLFKQAIDELIKIYKINPKSVIFTHNLGSFDGYFIFKYLSHRLPGDKLNTIIDAQKKFISINAEIDGLKMVWKDSFRIFPISLDKLCKNFGIPGKFSKYNQEFNNLDYFKNNKSLTEFKEYSIQDSVALLNCLIKAQQIYLDKFKVDITSIVSTSTLSLKIFRQHFQNMDIPILNNYTDKWIRQSYFGGATDYYKPYGEKLKYYDINSLYPHAMLKPMPLVRGAFSKNIDLNNFFGFCLAEITCPINIKVPLLPLRSVTGEVIYPTGTFKGIYFSEELKAVERYGYIIKPLNGWSFSKEYVFNDYVNHFYSIKKNSDGPQRFIAKMHLNQLYGYFGRSTDLIETKIVDNKDLDQYFMSRIVQNYIPVGDKCILLMSANPNRDLIKSLNKDFRGEINLENKFKEVKSNVAIASAVTSYARIEMMKYKTLKDCNIYYSDTDSIFIDGNLPDSMIGSELGQMKDELNGKVIERAYFLGVKQYGFQYLNENGALITKSVFSGVERDSLTFDEIIGLFKGKSLTKIDKVRFYKNFSTLNIIIKNDIEITIKMGSKKEIDGNQYIPFHVENGTIYDRVLVKYLKIKRKIKQMLTKFS